MGLLDTVNRWRREAATGEGEVRLEDKEDLEAQMEEFLKKQAEKESGAPVQSSYSRA